MAAFVQDQKVAGGFGNNPAVAFPGGVTAGSTLVASIYTDRSTVSSVSGCGATWSRVQGPDANTTTGGKSELWVGTGATTGTTITVTFAASCFYDILTAEFSGAASVITSAATNATSASPSSASVSATGSGQIAYAAVFRYNGGGSGITGWTDSPAAYTDISNQQDLSSAIDYAHGYRITTASGAHQRVGTAGSSLEWTGYGLILGAAAPPVSPPTARPVMRTQAVARAAVI